MSCASGRLLPGYRRYLFAIVVGVMMLNTVDRRRGDPGGPDQGSVSDSQMGMGELHAGLAAVLPLARWADRGVRRNIIALGLSVWSLFTLATGWVQGYVQLFVMRMGVGIGEASAVRRSILISTPFRRARSRASPSFRSGPCSVSPGTAGGGWVNELWAGARPS